MQRPAHQLVSMIAGIEPPEAPDDEACLAGAEIYVQHHPGTPQTPLAHFNFPATHYARRVLAECPQ